VLAGHSAGCEYAERDWDVPFTLDVRLTLSVQGRGRGDPTFRADDAGAIWRTSLTPDGPATLRVTSRSQAPGPEVLDSQELGSQALGTRVIARAWGPGATWLLDALPGCLGLHDDVSGFDPGDHPLIREAARRNPGLRIGRSGRLMEALVPAILEQKVVILEAHRAWKILLAKYGTPPPGPAPRGMRVFPEPAVWRRIPSWDWHRAGVEGVRAQTIIRAASVANSLERLLDLTHAEADRKLRTLPGIGVWTSAEARQRAAGDPDAVSVGDAHLSNIVGFALAGRDRTDDAGMLELLRPYEGHRYRVTRLIGLSTVRRSGDVPKRNAGGPPRRGPRMPVRDYRHF
jgi:3-methyladenine DNA glycosylase/8-oxoguanine DNA glycosylase